MATGLNDPMIVPSARVERRFFSIVRWCGLIVATAALLAAVIAAFGGGSKLLMQSDTTVRTPTTTYDDFRRTAVPSSQNTKPANKDTTLEEKEAEAARAAADAGFEKRLKPYLDAIVTNLGNYATKVGQAKPSAQGIGDYVRQSLQQIERYGSNELAWKYVEGL